MLFFVCPGRPETVGLFRAGLHRGPPGPRCQMCCEEALLRDPAAAQAVLQTLRPLSPRHQALQEPGESDQLQQGLVSGECCMLLSVFIVKTPFCFSIILSKSN